MMDFEKLWNELQKRQGALAPILNIEYIKNTMHFCYSVGTLNALGLLDNVTTIKGINRAINKFKKEHQQ